MEARVYRYLHKQGTFGATTLEIAAALNVPRDTVSPRMGVLQRRHLVYKTGMRRPGAGDRTVTVFAVSPTKPVVQAEKPVTVKAKTAQQVLSGAWGK